MAKSNPSNEKASRRGLVALVLAALGWLPIVGYAAQRSHDPAGMATTGGSLVFFLYALPAALCEMTALLTCARARAAKTAIVAIALALPALLLLGICAVALLIA